MPNNTQTKQSRILFSEAYMQNVYRTILEKVRICVNQQMDEFELVQHILTHRKLIQSTKLINWREIDAELKQLFPQLPYYPSKAYSYRAFWDVIVPNQLPPYSSRKFKLIDQFIRCQIQSNHQCILQMTRSTTAIFRKDLEQQVKDVFELDSTNVEYSYKKLSDKIRNHIQGRLNVACGVEKHQNTSKSTTHTDDEIMDVSVLFNIF
ncbi:Hypothetical_protein [Hexamita inflata]|uniref:Hypothetical_protein n=1 Tax=Hexamita inflata TaxID=28002 RepID=A0ABP1H736_9EUKA